ncbi:MAG: TolC family protein [Methylococcales bacterium]|nr:TolC family protein [Methylococcales bacterium]
MRHRNVVIIFSFLIISCSKKKYDEAELLKTNETIHISLPVTQPKENIKKTYIVKRGDTLYSLGLHLQVDFKKIATWNEIEPPYKITVGQELLVNKLAPIDYKQLTPTEKKVITNKNDNQPLDNSIVLSQNANNIFLGQHSLQRTHMVEEVLKANPQMGVARAVWQASTAKIKQQGSLKDPMLAFNMAPLTIDSDSTDFVQQLQLSQDLPWPGKLSLQNDTAMHNARKDEEKINLLRLELSALAKKLYGDWYFIHQAYIIHYENVQLLTHVNQIAKIRYRIGKANQQEILQSELELSLIEQHKYVLNQQRTEILGHINTLLSRHADTPLPIATSLPHPISMKTLSNLKNNGLDNHPKIKAISADIKSSELKKKTAILKAFPDFNIKAGYSTQMNNSDKHFTLGVAFNLPFNISKYQSIKDEAIANLKRAQWEKQDQVQELAELIQLYYSKVKKYKNTLVLYKRKILPLAKQNKKAALANYQTGSGGFLELIRAEKNWHSARLKEKQMLVDYHESLALFEYAVGITDVSTGNDL